jgi:putative endonuclease
MNKDWKVYLVECSDGTLYCGITNDLKKRIEDHNSGKGAKYTRGRGPVKLKAWVTTWNKSAALKLEYKVKQVRKDKKIDVLLTPPVIAVLDDQ